MSLVFHASIVETPGQRESGFRVAAQDPGLATNWRRLGRRLPSTYDLDVDGDPLFQRQSVDETTKGYKSLSLEGLLCFKN